MKRTNKLWLALLLTVLVAALLAVGLTAAAEETPAYAVGDHIQFGSYPQSRVEETEALQAAAQAATWKSYGYYSGTGDLKDGQMQPGDWMQFADFCCGGEKYRAVQFSQYRPIYTGDVSSAETSNQYDQGYFTDTVYYFKYEPLTWRILDPAAGLILCENVIDAQAFQNTIYGLYNALDSDTYAVDYPASSIRAWLNLDFYQTAFTPAQKAKIQTTYIETKSPSDSEYDPEAYDAAPTNDRIFLPSSWDVDNSQYGFLRGGCESDYSKTARGTDYARCQGLREGIFRYPDPATGISQDNLNAYWRLRSAYSYSDLTAVDETGENNCGHEANDSRYGIRPACCLSTLGDDTEQSEYLYSAVVDNGFCGGEGDGTNLTWTFYDDGTLVISGTGDMMEAGHPEDWPWFGSYRSQIRSVVIENGVTNIGHCAFYYYDNLTSVVIPDSVTSIEKDAFFACIRLTSISIPDSVTSIKNDAFCRCSSLSDITVPDSGISYGTDVVTHTAWYNAQPNGVVYLGKVAYTYKGSMPQNTTVQLRSDCLEIANYAFVSQGGLAAVELPNGLMKIGHNAFRNCTSLNAIVIPNTVTDLCSGAFSGCSSLTDVTISSGIDKIDDATFSECNSLQSITIPSNVKRIGDNVFCHCSSLNNVVIQNGVTTIGGGVFWDCTALKTVRIPDSVTSIGDKIFLDCSSLRSVWLSRGLTELLPYTLEGCPAMTAVLIPDSITKIGHGTFAHCTALQDIYYGGSKEDWNAVTIEGGIPGNFPYFNENISLQDANIHYNVVDWGYCGGEGDGTNLIWTLDNEGTLTISGEGAMKSYAFTSDNRIQFVIMENGVTDIGYSAFSTCASLREVSIPGSVTKIGLFAFEGCSSLKSVYIPEGVKIIDDCAFQYCWSLNSVYIPVSVEQIGWESFDLSPLKDVFCAGIRSQHNILFGENNTSLLKAKWHYNVFAGGYCGGEGDNTNLIWVLDNDGTLTVSGEGAMADYSESEPASWMEYFAASGAEITVLLEAGVTYIGKNAFPASDGLKELIVLNRDCDLSALAIREPAFLRGYLGSTAEDYGNAHADESLFMPLCDVDYRHAADWKVEWDDEEDPDRHIEGVYCFVCSEYIYARFDAHEWSEWETTKDPTVEAEGEETRTCSVCEKTETRSVEKLQPEGNGNNNNNNDNDNNKGGGGLLDGLRKAMTAIVRWFKKLLSFFSK